MLIAARSFNVDRDIATPCTVEVDVRAGLPTLTVIGLGAGSGRDLRERVQAAVLNSGFGLPRRRVTVNVAPAVRKGGPEFDLAVACCLLAAAGAIEPQLLARVALWAELALSGELRSCAGAGTVAEALAHEPNIAGLIVAPDDLNAAARAAPARSLAVRNLREACALLAAPSRALAQTLAGAAGRDTHAAP
jgi:magnesium chelatase family protein